MQNWLKQNWFSLGLLVTIALSVAFYLSSGRTQKVLINNCIQEVNRQFDGLRQGVVKAIADDNFAADPQFLIHIINSDAEEHKRRLAECL